jgi:hypothetical protein
MPQSKGAASRSERLGDVGGTVVAHHPPALEPLAVEPGDSTAEKADHRWLLLVRQDLDVGQPGGVIHSDVNLVIADAVGPSLLPVSRDPVTHPAEASQGLDVDMDQVTRSLPLVALHRWFGF